MSSNCPSLLRCFSCFFSLLIFRHLSHVVSQRVFLCKACCCHLKAFTRTDWRSLQFCLGDRSVRRSPNTYLSSLQKYCRCLGRVMLVLCNSWTNACLIMSFKWGYKVSYILSYKIGQPLNTWFNSSDLAALCSFTSQHDESSKKKCFTHTHFWS